MSGSLETSDKIAIGLAVSGVSVSVLAMATGNYGGALTDLGGILSLSGFIVALIGFIGRADPKKGGRDE
jgi:hypothetical protein